MTRYLRPRSFQEPRERNPIAPDHWFPGLVREGGPSTTLFSFHDSPNGPRGRPAVNSWMVRLRGPTEKNSAAKSEFALGIRAGGPITGSVAPDVRCSTKFAAETATLPPRFAP